MHTSAHVGGLKPMNAYRSDLPNLLFACLFFKWWLLRLDPFIRYSLLAADGKLRAGNAPGASASGQQPYMTLKVWVFKRDNWEAMSGKHDCRANIWLDFDNGSTSADG